MELRIYNTLTKRIEVFEPFEKGIVRMYVCGPTVYDYSHLGHGRTYVLFDALKRYLVLLGYNVFHVVNITDIDDKIINRARSEGRDWREIVDEYIRDDITAIGDVNPEDDFDGDRDTNLTEHENGTDPTDPTDFTVTPDDSDRDAMPDTWEQQIIDADPDDNIITIEDVNPHDDFDGDEKSNLMEYDNGTDPIIPAPIQPGDLDGDEHLTLADAVIALKIACGLDSGVLIGADADGDGKIGVAEVVFILQKVAGFEANPEF